MAKDWQTLKLHDNFYRDQFIKVILIIVSIFMIIIFLGFLSFYLYWNKPEPILFPVGQDFRVEPLVSLEDPNLSLPEVFQWVSDVIRKSFIYDFKNYQNQVKLNEQYFTDNGWKTFLNQLNLYVNYTNVQTNKLFVYGELSAAPTLINQGVVNGRFIWIIQMPVTIVFAGYRPLPRKTLNFEIRVVRVTTEDNLAGVAIDNIILAATGSK